MHRSSSHSGEALRHLETIELPTTKEAWKKGKVRYRKLKASQLETGRRLAGIGRGTTDASLRHGGSTGGLRPWRGGENRSMGFLCAKGRHHVDVGDEVASHKACLGSLISWVGTVFFALHPPEIQM